MDVFETVASDVKEGKRASMVETANIFFSSPQFFSATQIFFLM